MNSPSWCLPGAVATLLPPLEARPQHITAVMVGLDIKGGASPQPREVLWVEGREGGTAQILPVTLLTKASLPFLPRASCVLREGAAPGLWKALGYHPWNSEIVNLLCIGDLVGTLLSVNQS